MGDLLRNEWDCPKVALKVTKLPNVNVQCALFLDFLARVVTNN
jgi:hypothetical protein